MKLHEMTIDADRVEQGAWVDDIPEMGDLRLKVRGFGNSDFRKMQARLYDAEPRQNKTGGRLNPDRQDYITARCMLHTILIDWDNVEDANGKVPYSRDFAETMLTDPKYRRFRDAVAYAATIVAESSELDQQDSAGNFETPSSGS